MSSAADRRHATLRALDVLEVLCAHPASGVTNAAIAHATGSTPSHVTRDLAVLMAKGWARKDEATGRFFAAPAFTRLAFRVLADFERAEQRLADLRHAFTGGIGRQRLADLRRTFTGA